MKTTAHANIWVGQINEGEALALPPGFIFADMTSHTGVSGLKIPFVHRGSLARLQHFKAEANLFSKDAQPDGVLDAIVEDLSNQCCYFKQFSFT